MRRSRAAAAVLASAGIIAGCGGGDDGRGGFTARQAKIYDQQRTVCRVEQRHDTIEYRENAGDDDPRHYAEHAARHGFYELEDPGDLDVAIEGCLDGLQ